MHRTLYRRLNALVLGLPEHSLELQELHVVAGLGLAEEALSSVGLALVVAGDGRCLEDGAARLDIEASMSRTQLVEVSQWVVAPVAVHGRLALYWLNEI